MSFSASQKNINEILSKIKIKNLSTDEKLITDSNITYHSGKNEYNSSAAA